MTYLQSLRYLASLVDYEQLSAYPYSKSFRRERITEFLALLGNPQQGLCCVHVAGSKGKGSTCAFIAYMLRAAGFRTGLYTSPHLKDFRERIRVLEPHSVPQAEGAMFEGMISRASLARLVTSLEPSVATFNRASSLEPLTFFEVYTALAFLYFKAVAVDFVVLETGLGGRLDATNVVDSLVAVIAPISYEHTDKLGHTLHQIAREKAGIIKRGIGRRALVISAPQTAEARAVIRSRCKDRGATLFEVGREITCRRSVTGFSVRGLFGTYPRLAIGLLGKHQMVNAATAVGAVEALRLWGISVGEEAIRTGLAQTRWPGRAEVCVGTPLVVLDGAQNAASARALSKTIRECFRFRRLTLVLGLSSDKDIRGVCTVLRRLADEVVLTRAASPRAASPETLRPYFKGKRVSLTKSVQEAKRLALRSAGKKDLVLVCGSLFVVGEFRAKDEG